MDTSCQAKSENIYPKRKPQPCNALRAPCSDGMEPRHYKANYLLVQNIQSLLAGRGETARLAQWAHHKPAWLSKILAGDRGIKLSDLDKIADFFGLTVAQLFQHGISPLTERRRTNRRSGTDRRSGQDRRQSELARGIHPDVSRIRFRSKEADES